MNRLLCLLLLFAVSVRADEVANAGRAILKKHQDAVVGVKIVAKVALPGRESTQEIKVDTIGMTVDATGLTVASLRNVEPGELLSRVAGRDLQAEITDIKIVLADRSEIAAALVLRDKDLDLAFLRPTEKLPKPASVISLTAAAKPELLDNVIVLSRSTRTPRLEPVLCDARIAAIVDKPRLFYLGTAALQNNSPGSAVFALDGRFIGQLLLRRTTKGETWGVIIPAADIADIAKQAPAEAPKPAAPTEEKKPVAPQGTNSTSSTR